MTKKHLDIRLASRADLSGIRDTETGLRGLRKTVSSVGENLKKLGKEFLRGGVWGVAMDTVRRLGSLLKDTLGNAFSDAFRFESTTRQFEFLLGNIDKAKVHMQQLKELGDTPPFSLDEFAKASRQMIVLSDGALGFKGSLEKVGDAAAATGVDVATMGHEVAKLYAYIRDGQPLSRAVMALRNMGVISPEVAQKLQDMQKAGKSSVEIWQEFETALNRFSGAMKNVESTSQGLIGTIGTRFSNIWRQFAAQLNGEVAPALKKVADGMKAVEDSGVGAKAGKVAGLAAGNPSLAIGVLGALTNPINVVKALGGAAWDKIKSLWNRPMSREELSAQRSIAERRLANAGSPAEARRYQRQIERIDAALRSAPATAERDRAEEVKAIVAGKKSGNPFRKGSAAYDYYERGLIDETGQATKAYKEQVEKEQLAAQEAAKVREDLARAQAARDKARAIEIAKAEAQERERLRIKELQDAIASGKARGSDLSRTVASASAEFDRAFAMFRDPARAAAEIGEEKAYAKDLDRLHRTAASYGGKWRIDELSRLMAAGDTQGITDTLGEWRRSKGFTPEVESMVRASAAERTRTTAEDELRKISANTDGLARKLEELISMKGG